MFIYPQTDLIFKRSIIQFY